MDERKSVYAVVDDEQPSGICVTVKPWADGTVHSWFESRGRADAEAQWMARGGGL